MEITPGTKFRGPRSGGTSGGSGPRPPEPPGGSYTPTKQENVLKFLAVFVVVSYAWLTAKLLEPKFPQPPTLVSQVAWIEDAQAKTVAEVKGHRFLEVEQLGGDLKSLEPTLRAIGGLRIPVTLVINVDQPKRYSISDDRIEIGANYVSQPDEMRLAFLKAWIYQHAKPEVISSLFRVEVSAKALNQMLFSAVTFEPRPKLQNWLKSAASYDKLCFDKKISHELESACGTSQALAQVSFSSLIASMVVRLHDSLAPIDRLAYTQAFARKIENVEPSDQALTLSAGPTSLNEWKPWLKSEFEYFAPETEDNDVKLAHAAALKNVGVNEDQTTRVDFFFLNEADIQTVSESKSTFIMRAQGSEDATLFPARVSLTHKDIDQLGSTKWLVWESCRVPKLGEVLQKAVRADKIIYLQTCGKEKSEIASAFESLMHGGIEGLAKAAPDMPFLQLKADAVDLALRKGSLENDMPVTVYMEKSAQHQSGASRLLGLTAAQWKNDMKAYRVMGAIEAVEWFRSPPTEM